MNKIIFVALLACAPMFAQTPDASTLFDGQLKGPESEAVSLVEAMPAEAFNFVPKSGAFEKSRTFAQQAKHIAFVNYQVAAALVGEPNPSKGGADENGPADITSKEQIVKYMKDSFAYCHKAMATLTNQNLMETVADPFNSKRMTPRVSIANIILWHTFDHYGQMVIYARMNNVVPPASR